MFFNKITPQLIGKKVLLCSDDKKIASTLKWNNKITLVSALNSKNDSELQSLIDLIALGGASELFYTNLTYGNYSGFSGLAGYLCENKKIIDQLLKESFFKKKLLEGNKGVIIIKTPIGFEDLYRNFRRDYLNKSWFIKATIIILRRIHLFYPSRFIYRKFKSFGNQ